MTTSSGVLPNTEAAPATPPLKNVRAIPISLVLSPSWKDLSESLIAAVVRLRVHFSRHCDFNDCGGFSFKIYHHWWVVYVYNDQKSSQNQKVPLIWLLMIGICQVRPHYAMFTMLWNNNWYDYGYLCRTTSLANSVIKIRGCLQALVQHVNIP